LRIKIQFTGKDPVRLPAGFNEYIQALIYNHLNIDEAKWLHSAGFAFEKRKFRLFTFSSVLEPGKYNRGSSTFLFPSNISFYISSPVDWILEQLAGNFIKSESVSLGNNALNVASVEIIKNPAVNSDSIKVKAVTPIEVHSTFTLENGKKKTHYYTPFEEDFSGLVESNLKKKWTAYYKNECPHSISIKPLFRGNDHEKIVYFGAGGNRTVIKGWKGYFQLKGNPEFLNYACEVGLGSRNSQGFGMVEAVPRAVPAKE
jgi:CRISPR-associated endoribonuclease Cas6